MFIALDENNNRVSSNDAIKGKDYKCPVCGEKLELRKGEVRMHHFAHWKKSECLDKWSHDMSEWHFSWQNKFPIECQEVVVEADGKKHRADVLIEEHKLVIEFQHSRITPEEFDERNQFYTECGYHVVWLFDMSEEFDNGGLELSEDDSAYAWKKPLTVFTKLNRRYAKEVDVFAEHGGQVEKVINYSSEKKQIVTSGIKKQDSFAWSTNTFLLWLKKTCSIHHMSRPNCPKCRAAMALRRYSFGGALWGCRNFYEKNCRGMIDLGKNPVKVSYDDKCPYCDGSFDFDELGMRCYNCGFTVSFKID